MQRKTLALVLTTLGTILAFSSPFLPGGKHLTAYGPPLPAHVTELIGTPNGVLLVGTQDGTIWRLHDGLWDQERVELDGHAILAMLGDPKSNPIGTSDGLYQAPVGAPPLSGRISSLLRTDHGLMAGTPHGVRLLEEGQWQQPGPQANVYTLFHQRQSHGEWLHAGTIDQGVISTAAAQADAPWQPNNQGLPEHAKAFCFAMTREGQLLVGTDQGLYWQTQPGQTWEPVIDQLQGKRVLSLHLSERDGVKGSDRLWIGGDDGLFSLDIEAQDGAVSTLGRVVPADDAEHQPDMGISWIVKQGNRLLVSAGIVYRYGPTRFPGWYWFGLTGLILIIIAGVIIPRPQGPDTARE